MKKLADLTEYLQDLNLFNAEKFNSWVEDLTIITGGEHEYYTPAFGQILLCVERYTAQFEIADFPHNQVDISVLMAHVSAWLLENELSYKTLPYEIPVNAEVYDDNTALIEFAIEFDEFVIGVKDAINGTVTVNGTKYRIEHDPA